jgi:hypothetical protein
VSIALLKIPVGLDPRLSRDDLEAPRDGMKEEFIFKRDAASFPTHPSSIPKKNSQEASTKRLASMPSSGV